MSKNNKDMTRGSFLSVFAVAPLAGAALAASSGSAFAADSEVALNFHFCGDSYHVNTNQQTGGPYSDRLVMSGSGQIQGKLQVGQSTSSALVNAQGSFAHYQLTENLLTGGPPLAPPPPAGNNIPLKFTGTWKATNLVSFQWIGLYGLDANGNSPLAAAVLVLDIVLVRPSTPVIPLTRVPSRLWLVSTLGTGTGAEHLEPAGFSPALGLAEGVPLTDGVTLLAPNNPAGGFFFVPIPVVSTAPDVGEPHTSVMFSTMNENRNEPTNGSVVGNG
jgi:hypothetical protein